VRLEKLAIRNFRCFGQLELELAGDSLVVVGPNAAGKSTLLAAARTALHGGSVSKTDLRDIEVPAELVATLSGITPATQGAFADVMDFAVTPPVLRIGVRATWDPDELEVEVVHGFPDNAWSRAGRVARDQIPILALSAWRDATKLTPVIGRSSLLGELVLDLDLEQELDEAVSAITIAGQRLAEAQPLEDLLVDVSGRLGTFLAHVGEHAYSLGLDIAQPRDVLGQLQLLLTYAGTQTAATRHSSGLAQGTVFALALALLDRRPGTIVLIDEPEVAFHPQAQRALIGAVREVASQSLIATHSAAILDRRDPREVLRLRRDAAGSDVRRASGMSEDDARRLSRYSTSLTAEAFFADVVVLVEGFSDLLAVRTLARLIGVDLDGVGVSLIALEGQTLLKQHHALFGPDGLDLQLRGLCDADAEGEWIARLSAAGLAVIDRASMALNGFYVCDPDLEAELLGALSEAEIENVIDADGALHLFTALEADPSNAGVPKAELQSRFVKKDKVRWAPLLAAASEAPNIPAPVAAVLAGL
jgi:putative ATP-dependent endonuclease of OLD family